MLKYVVRLAEEERTALTELTGKGKAAARKIKHANVLLKLDADGPNWSDAQAAEVFNCNARTVLTIRQRFLELGLAAALERKPREHPPREQILDGDARHSGCGWPARAHRRDKPAGPSVCWPPAWSNCRWWRRFRRKPSCAH